MKKDDLFQLKHELENVCRENNQQYQRIIQKIDSTFFDKSSYERFLINNKNEDNDLLDILWQLERDDYYSLDNEQTRIDNLLFPYLYEDKEELTNEDKEFCKKYRRIVQSKSLINDNFLYKLIDTEILNFIRETDIIITDPCYVFSKDWDKDWTKLMDSYIYHDTLYGDWSATVYKTDKTNLKDFLNDDMEMEIGDFCADAGLVGVFVLDKVKEYNPEFIDNYMTKKGLVTLINNFKGTVQIKVDYINESFKVYVEGKGNINFYGVQTGF